MSAEPKFFPNHLRHRWPTRRSYKVDKRRAIHDLNVALVELRMGCAYMPPKAYLAVQKIEEQLRILREECSAERWGR